MLWGASLVKARGKSEVGFGSASYYMEVAPEAFDASYYADCYTTAYIENKALSGIYMLLEQAYPAFELWTGRRVEPREKDLLKRALYNKMN